MMRMNSPRVPILRSKALLFGLLLGCVAVLGIFRWFWIPVLIVGPSMLPTLESGELVWMRKDLPAELRRFDVVVTRTRLGLMTKRIVGLPGECLSMEKGALYVNGVELHEAHPLHKGSWSLQKGTLRPDHYLLIGDNRDLPERIVLIVDRSEILARLATR